MLQKPRLPAITCGAQSSTLRNSQSHTTSPAPRFCTAHHGALPKLPAWLAAAQKPIAAANPAPASVDLKLIVMAQDCHGAKIVMAPRLSWRGVQAAAMSMQDEAADRDGPDLPDVVRGKEKHENDGGGQ